jgi:hypothetical protein
VPFDLLDSEDEDSNSLGGNSAGVFQKDDVIGLESDVQIVVGDISANDSQTEAALLFEQICSIVDQLFSLALQIRSPATRRVPAIHKVDLFKHIAPDFKEQFIRMTEEREYNGLVQIFQQCRREARGQGQDDIQQTEPLREEDEFLLRRLLKANHVRRCRFQYWKRYKSKSIQFTSKVTREDELLKPTPSLIHRTPSHQIEQSTVRQSGFSHQPSSRMTSELPLPPGFTLKGPVSSKSSRAATITVEGPDGLVVSWPLPPSYARRKIIEFECPYCFFMCPAHTTREDAWRYQTRHIQRDVS